MGVVEIAGLIAAAALAVGCVAAWALSTPRRRDELARDFAKQVFLVDGIAHAGDAGVRALHPYLVRAEGGSVTVLAETSLAAAELVASREGARVAVSCLLGKHRVVSLPQGGWAVAVLPPWLGFLGKTCEHGPHHD